MQDVATKASVASTTSRYRPGATSFLQVVDNQRTVLAVQRRDVEIRGAWAMSTVALIRAVAAAGSRPTSPR